MQQCLENYLFAEYDNRQEELQQSIARIRTLDLSYLPDEYQDRLNESFAMAAATFELVDEVRRAERALEEYSPKYRPQHVEVRRIQKSIRKLGEDIEELNQQRQRISFSDNVDQQRIDKILATIAELKQEQKRLEAEIPDTWTAARAEFNRLAKAEKIARLKYRQNVDDSYAAISLAALLSRIDPLITQLRQDSAENALEAVDSLADQIDRLSETHRISAKLSRAKRALRGDSPDTEKAIAEVIQAGEILQAEVDWRQRAAGLAADLQQYDRAIANTLGTRMQQRLTAEQAESIASCLSVHRDVSLYF